MWTCFLSKRKTTDISVRRFSHLLQLKVAELVEALLALRELIRWNIHVILALYVVQRVDALRAARSVRACAQAVFPKVGVMVLTVAHIVLRVVVVRALEAASLRYGTLEAASLRYGTLEAASQLAGRNIHIVRSLYAIQRTKPLPPVCCIRARSNRVFTKVGVMILLVAYIVRRVKVLSLRAEAVAQRLLLVERLNVACRLERLLQPAVLRLYLRLLLLPEGRLVRLIVHDEFPP
jgi:hypothetical protein